MKLSKNKTIFIAGHKGMVGSAILRHFKNNGYKNTITANKDKLNLLNQKETENFFLKIKPDFVVIAAAKVGGIMANQNYKANFIYENLMIQTNIIHSAYKIGVKKLIFLGSSCIYPKFAKQPIKEKYLLSGNLEPTNDAYSIAKIAGVKMCEAYNKQYNLNYICLMPTNLYGPNDNYDKLNSHFFPALIQKVHDLKISKKKDLVLWGNGKAKREMIYVDDVADACVYFMNKKIKHTIINIGTGKDFTITEYAKKILNVILPDKKIRIKYDLSKPNGTPRKVLDVSLAKKYGWKPKVLLKDGIFMTYKNFLSSKKK